MPTEQHTAEMHAVRAALVRGATPVCADTRIAGHVVTPDPVAAASALPDLTVSGAAQTSHVRKPSSSGVGLFRSEVPGGGLVVAGVVP